MRLPDLNRHLRPGGKPRRRVVRPEPGHATYRQAIRDQVQEIADEERAKAMPTPDASSSPGCNPAASSVGSAG